MLRPFVSFKPTTVLAFSVETLKYQAVVRLFGVDATSVPPSKVVDQFRRWVAAVSVEPSQ